MGLPIASPGLRGKFFEQVPILLSMEILGHAINTLEHQRIPADVLFAALCRYFHGVGALFVCRPFGVENAGGVRIGRHFHERSRILWAEKMRFHARIAQRHVVFVAHVGRYFHVAVIEQHGIGNGGIHAARRIRNEPAQKLLPKRFLRFVFNGKQHSPMPGG